MRPNGTETSAPSLRQPIVGMGDGSMDPSVLHLMFIPLDNLGSSNPHVSSPIITKKQKKLFVLCF